MFTCFKKLREKCICSRDHWESLPVVFHSLIRMLDLDLSNASVSPTGDDENWMKHTLSWLDKPHVEDAKVRSPKTKSSQLSWIGGNYFFTYWRTVPFWCFRVPKKCWGWLFWVYRYIHWFQWLAAGSMLFANIGTWFTHYFNKWLGNCPKKTDFLSDSLWHPEVPRSQAPSVKVVLKYRRVIDQPLDKVPKWAGWWVVWRLKISKNWIWLKVYVG